jgi:spore maturation protein CgeB
MKFLRISSVPAKQLNNINSGFDLLGDVTYEVALDNYFKKFIATSDAFVYELNLTGKCEANEVVFNHKKLQNLWIKTHEPSLSSNEISEIDILKYQIAFYNPDVIFVNTNLVSYEQLEKILKKKTYLMAWDGFIKPLLEFNAKYDLVLTCLDSIAEKFQKNGTKSEVLDFAFDRRVLDYVSLEKTEKLNFVGNFTYVHIERQAFLKALGKADLDLSLYIGNYDMGNNPFSRTMAREVLQNKRISTLPDVYKFQRQNKGAVYGLDMYQVIGQSFSTLNFHGDEVDKACNMRLFEATGLGTCLITDDKPGLEKFFKVDEEVVVFKNEKDLVDKVRYLQENESVAKRIGEAGQKRVIAQHLWSNRVLELLDIIDKNI